MCTLHGQIIPEIPRSTKDEEKIVNKFFNYFVK